MSRQIIRKNEIKPSDKRELTFSDAEFVAETIDVEYLVICYNMSIRLEKRDIFCLGKQKWISG